MPHVTSDFMRCFGLPSFLGYPALRVIWEYIGPKPQTLNSPLNSRDGPIQWVRVKRG